MLVSTECAAALLSFRYPSFSTLFPFLYFDLTKQKMDIKDGTTKLTFKYELSGTTAVAYSIYALTLYEQDVELIQKDGKIILTS